MRLFARLSPRPPLPDRILFPDVYSFLMRINLQCRTLSMYPEPTQPPANFFFLVMTNEDSQDFLFSHMRHLFFSEVSIGVLANTVLLLSHVLTVLLQHRPKPTDLTIGHLALVHLAMLLTMGFIAADTLGLRGLGSDISCKSVIYVQRLMRGLSICTTCLLSVLQAITLSPRSSRLAKFKQLSPLQSLCCFPFLWVFNLLVNARFLVSTVATPNVTTHTLMFVTKSCSILSASSVLRYAYFTLVTFPDVSLIGLMSLSSGYMVALLCRHKRQCQHLHGPSLSPKASPEQRATQTILLLMSFFVAMYFLDCAVSSSSGMLWNNDPVRRCVQMLVGNGYATVSPLVLISAEKQTFKFLTTMWGKLCSVIPQ